MSRAAAAVLFLISPLVHANPTDWASQNNGRCFERHLKEAIHVNRLRAADYSKLTGGRSERISKLLVFLDRTGLPFGKYFDLRAREIPGSSGVSLVCEVIPSMLPVLEKPLSTDSPIDLKRFRPFSVRLANREIRAAYKQGGLAATRAVLSAKISELNQEPRFNCLSRQFITSMDRLVEVSARAPNRGEAEKLGWELMKATLLQLRMLTQLDRMAAPIQAAGIPMLCAENPKLPNF